MAPDETASYDLTLTNNGAGRLLWSASCLMDPVTKRVVTATAASEVRTPIGYREGDPEKAPGVQEPYYETVDKGVGGPDTFGYSWIDSDELGGPAFDWIDISGVGTAQTLVDDGNVQLTFGFDFPFYDSSYSGGYLCSNGYLCFDTGYGMASNYAMPSTSLHSGAIAAWWDDIDPPEGGSVYTYHDAANGRYIISFVNIQNYISGGGTGDLTFQMILYANGRIVLQYGTMDPGADSDGLEGATIGIQNSTEDDGLTVVYNAAYMHDNMAIQISAASWLEIPVAAGQIDPYATGVVTLNFNAEDMEEGIYTGSLTLGCNDPVHPSTLLPVTMDVSSGCCTGPSVGNIDGSPDNAVTMEDLTILVDALFISLTPPACLQEADIDLSGAPDPVPGDLTMNDLTILIDHLFITLSPLPACP